jgi:hypothetical protein
VAKCEKNLIRTTKRINTLQEHHKNKKSVETCSRYLRSDEVCGLSTGTGMELCLVVGMEGMGVEGTGVEGTGVAFSSGIRTNMPTVQWTYWCL